MVYGITSATVGDWRFVEISRKEFEDIKTAKTKLLVVLNVDEKFELLIENYAEFEHELGEIARRRRTDEGEWTDAMDDLLQLNRRLANVLMAARLYTDQIKHYLAELYGDDSAAGRAVLEAFSREYDAALGFRVMEAVRNYVQHRAVPIARVTYGLEEATSNPAVRQFTVNAELDVHSLDYTFKPAVLTELRQQPHPHNVTLFLRDYMRGLRRVHNFFRELTAGDVRTWCIRIRLTLDVGRQQVQHMLGLAAVARDLEGVHREIVYVFEAMLGRLDAIRDKHRDSGWLAT